MQTPSRLKPRHLEILNAIVRWFIETGEPVGSHSIARTRREPLSPATIRNAMADLAEEGYLSQPHTSAGRIPTEKAFRLYVSALTAGRLAAVEAERAGASPREVPATTATDLIPCRDRTSEASARLLMPQRRRRSRGARRSAADRASLPHTGSICRSGRSGGVGHA